MAELIQQTGRCSPRRKPQRAIAADTRQERAETWPKPILGFVTVPRPIGIGSRLLVQVARRYDMSHHREISHAARLAFARADHDGRLSPRHESHASRGEPVPVAGGKLLARRGRVPGLLRARTRRTDA